MLCFNAGLLCQQSAALSFILYLSCAASLRPDLRHKFRENLEAACAKNSVNYELLKFSSFELAYGYGWNVSPADVVYAMTGVLTRHTQEADYAEGTERHDDFW